jgi:beta-galactosidase
MGFNYKPDNYIPFHQRFPQQFFFSTESASTISSRGEYFFPVVRPGFGAVSTGGRGGRGTGRGRGPTDGVDFNSRDNATRQMSSYDLYYPGWASSPDHEFFGQDHSAACAGEFVWTGWDYIGEPTPFNSRSSYFGIIDLAGFPKDRYYLYQAHWRPDLPMAHILPHWNWPERKGLVTPVHVYTSGDEAELFLNGKSLGKKAKGKTEYRLRWDDVVYQPGELKVIAYKNGAKWAEDRVVTTGRPSMLSATADRQKIRNDGTDLVFVTVKVEDKNGMMVPRSNNLISFTVEGAARIVAVDNGDATSHDPFQASFRKAYNGMCLVILKAEKGVSGAFTVTASSKGLKSASVKVETE